MSVPRGDEVDTRVGQAGLCACLFALGVLSACGAPPPAQQTSNGFARADLIPASSNLERVNDLVMNPLGDSIDPDPKMAEMIRLGYEIFRDTRTYAPEFVGNDLSCGNCHLNAGQRDLALPLIGVAGTFPQYRNRDDRVVSLEDRIAGCFKRSMNGTVPPHDDPVMIALDAYITWLGEGFPLGEQPGWRGRNQIPRDARIPIEELDVAQGESLFRKYCAPCHGPDGQGLDLIIAKPGPLWGPRSWNDGAGAARVWTLAGYIRYAMPLVEPGSLTDEQAQLIAAYINSHDRPEYEDKASDFPGGGRPADAVYDTLVFKRHPLRQKLTDGG